ncbi:MAG TPA: serine/threonine-protein kinase [Gemmatimonadaceae bacterium]
MPEVIAGRYTIEREIGRGGMATVYLGSDGETGDRVAIKLLRSELGSAVVLERFLREIAFVSELDHPQIPKVLGSGHIGKLPYYVMTYIEGESLRARLDREGQLAVEEVRRIAESVARAMAYAHSRGILHRDIKPGNILISADHVHVLDFGVARAIIASAENALTAAGMVVGTPAYMSPEQALADGSLDGRSDIYSLGCVMYEMLAGTPPFLGATAQAIMSRRFLGPPRPLDNTRDDIPAPLSDAIMKSLAKDVEDRWQTAEEFADALTENRPTPASSPPPAPAPPEVKRYSRNNVFMITGGIALVAIIAIISVLLGR